MLSVSTTFSTTTACVFDDGTVVLVLDKSNEEHRSPACESGTRLLLGGEIKETVGGVNEIDEPIKLWLGR